MGKAAGLCTHEQYKKIVGVISDGFVLETSEKYEKYKPSPMIATAIVVEANTGIRIGDVLQLRRSSFVETSNGYRFNIIEEKTGKRRTFPVQQQLYDYLMGYVEQYVDGDNLFFPTTVRNVQSHIRSACEFLGSDYSDISTHSFRKMFASTVYYSNGCDIELTRRLLQHSSATVTARYIGVSDKKIEQALNSAVDIV